MLACARLSRAAGVTGRRCIATYAIRSPPEALLRDLWQQQSDEEAELPSQRDATAGVARRQQWATVPIESCPRSLQAAMQEPCNEARIITEGQYPYRVVFANKAWEHMCGWSAQEVEGQHGLSFLHGEATDRAKLKRVGAAVKYGERVDVRLINYKKDGTPFLNRLRVTPLTTSLGQYTHMLGILQELPMPAQQIQQLREQQQQAQQEQQEQQQMQHV